MHSFDSLLAREQQTSSHTAQCFFVEDVLHERKRWRFDDLDALFMFLLMELESNRSHSENGYQNLLPWLGKIDIDKEVV